MRRITQANPPYELNGDNGNFDEKMRLSVLFLEGGQISARAAFVTRGQQVAHALGYRQTKLAKSLLLEPGTNSNHSDGFSFIEDGEFSL